MLVSPFLHSGRSNKKVLQVVLGISLSAILVSCAGKQFIIKNIDNLATAPLLVENRFVLSGYANDSRYGYDPQYPINCFYQNTANDEINQKRFLEALTGPKGEKVFYKKKTSCCPFTTKNSDMGAGFLDIYEVTYVGLAKPLVLYFNIYERGALLVPIGFELKK